MWVVFTLSINNYPRHSWTIQDNTSAGSTVTWERECGRPAAPPSLPGGRLYIRTGYRPTAVTHWHLPTRGGCSSHTLGSRQRVCEGTSRCRESGVAVVMGGEPWREDFTHAGRTICGVTQEVPGAVWFSQGEGRLRHVVNMRGKTDWSSPISTLSTLVLPTL